MSINPIGIFDSGIGGLTVALRVNQELPRENIIYFGDTAHLPYGDKSAADIQFYSLKICDFLLAQQCKIILIACNSASSAASTLIQEHVGNKAYVINVIDPVVEHIKQFHSQNKIGLIGTKQTVSSNAYQKKLTGGGSTIDVKALATPLLVPAIEAHFHQSEMIQLLVHDYLKEPSLDNIETLILGCTHYPLIKQHIINYYQHRLPTTTPIEIIDSAELVVHFLKNFLDNNNLHNTGLKKLNKFYVSKYTPSYVATAKVLFQENIELEYFPMWEKVCE